jgi:hypothetical protein
VQITRASRSSSALSNRAQISARGNPSDFEEAISRRSSERAKEKPKKKRDEKKGVFILHSLSRGRDPTLVPINQYHFDYGYIPNHS